MSVKPKKDALGDRMKENFENRARHYFPRRTYILIRVDMRAGHTWTRGLEKPYDKYFMECMDIAAIALCKEAAGAKFAFVQSDEISLLMTDFEDISSQAWFDNCQNKIESITASIATMAFNLKVAEFNREGKTKLGIIKKPNAMFDSRAWVIPDPIEVENYFIDRQQDAARNSVTLLASNYASHKQLHGKSVSDRHEIIHAAGDNWAKHPVRFKHGGVVRRILNVDHPAYFGPDLTRRPAVMVTRASWGLDEYTPEFTKNRNYLREMIPRHWENELKESANA